jgi:MFS family permease
MNPVMMRPSLTGQASSVYPPSDTSLSKIISNSPIVSVFFITQFLTSLLWATIAEKHGRRLVLFISLLGSALACAAFGTSTSLKQAIAIRLLQGVFAGAIGVARSAVPFITNPSNGKPP